MNNDKNLINILKDQSKTRGDVRVTRGWIDDNKERHTVKWQKISESSDDFLAKANLRELWCDEVVLDYDNKDFNGDCSEKIADMILSLCKEKHSFTCWKTCSNGYHFHLQFSEMSQMNEEERKNIRRWFIKKYSADPNKISGLISIPEAPHWKTNQLMRLVAVM